MLIVQTRRGGSTVFITFRRASVDGLCFISDGMAVAVGPFLPIVHCVTSSEQLPTAVN